MDGGDVDFLFFALEFISVVVSSLSSAWRSWLAYYDRMHRRRMAYSGVTVHHIISFGTARHRAFCLDTRAGGRSVDWSIEYSTHSVGHEDYSAWSLLCYLGGWVRGLSLCVRRDGTGRVD